jgi:inosine-uridine nucleoside N-ribohydrolase
MSLAATPARVCDYGAMTRPVILDCDTGTDDAIAIMLAALHPEIELLGVTTVHGNHPVSVTTDNTLRVLDHIGRSDVGVYAGADAPYSPRLAAPDSRILQPHLPLPEPTSEKQEQAAAAWLAETLTARPVTFVATGPLTNLAAAIDLEPGIVDTVEEVVFLGGTQRIANVTALAERNVWNDPAAAAKVFTAGFKRLVVVPLDATYRAQVSADDAERLRELGTPAGRAAATLVHERIEQYADAGTQQAPVHDPLTVAYVIDGGVLSLQEVHVEVVTAAGGAYGRTEVKRGEPNAFLALDADRVQYVDLLVSTFS